MDYFELIEEQKKQLFEKFPQPEGYYVRINSRWSTDAQVDYYFKVPFIIYKDHLPIATITFTEKDNFEFLKTTSIVKLFFEIIGVLMHVTYSSTNKHYCVLLPNQDQTSGDSNIEYGLSFDNVVEKIKDMACGKDKSLAGENSFQEVNSHIQSELKFFHKEENQLDPEWCREQLSEVAMGKICRYTTLESLFSTIKFMTFRMNGLPGMNDTSEGLFAWEMIYSASADMEEDVGRRTKLNDAFIVSFSRDALIDDLNQWRLYGDDARGVCCVYEIDKQNIKDRFFLHEVRYVKKTESYDDEIEDGLLADFKSHVKRKGELSYQDLSPVIFYFKPADFSSEKEVRLLVDNKVTSAYKTAPYKTEWLLTKPNGIPNPYIDIPLSSLPLKLKKIILGPNMNDKSVILAQLTTMLHQQGLDVIIEPSEIQCYRNSSK